MNTSFFAVQRSQPISGQAKIVSEKKSSKNVDIDIEEIAELSAKQAQQYDELFSTQEEVWIDAK